MATAAAAVATRNQSPPLRRRCPCRYRSHSAVAGSFWSGRSGRVSPRRSSHRGAPAVPRGSCCVAQLCHSLAHTHTPCLSVCHTSPTARPRCCGSTAPPSLRCHRFRPAATAFAPPPPLPLRHHHFRPAVAAVAPPSLCRYLLRPAGLWRPAGLRRSAWPLPLRQLGDRTLCWCASTCGTHLTPRCRCSCISKPTGTSTRRARSARCGARCAKSTSVSAVARTGKAGTLPQSSRSQTCTLRPCVSQSCTARCRGFRKQAPSPGAATARGRSTWPVETPRRAGRQKGCLASRSFAPPRCVMRADTT